MRIGVFLPNWIGDVVMATPAIRALRKYAGCDGQLVGIMRPYVSDVLAGTGWLDDVVLYEKEADWSGLNPTETYRKLRAHQLERVVLLTNSFRTAWMAWRSGAGQRIGYRGDVRSWLLSQRVPRSQLPGDRQPLPTLDAYLRLVEAAGCLPESPRLELATTEEDEDLADIVWQQRGLPPGDRVIVLNSGGAYGASKQWPAEHFAELARRIITDWSFSVLVHCGPHDRAAAAEIVARANDPRVVGLSNLEQLPIGLSKACIRRSRLLVTTDSGPRFFGIAFGRPVVTLFGPTDPAATRINYNHESCLSLALECQPCMERTCPLGHHRCMRELSVDRVYNAVAAQLTSKFVQGAA